MEWRSLAGRQLKATGWLEIERGQVSLGMRTFLELSEYMQQCGARIELGARLVVPEEWWTNGPEDEHEEAGEDGEDERADASQATTSPGPEDKGKRKARRTVADEESRTESDEDSDYASAVTRKSPHNQNRVVAAKRPRRSSRGAT